MCTYFRWKVDTINLYYKEGAIQKAKKHQFKILKKDTSKISNEALQCV